MATKYQTSFILWTLTVAISCSVLTGCQSFEIAGSTAVEEEAPVVNKADVIGQYQMQLIPRHGAPSVEKVDITGPVTVQDAIEAAGGALRKFGPMKISLGRIIKEKGTLLKLPVDYQLKTKTVRSEQNYHLLPGDTITISPKESKSFEKVLESITGGAI